MMNLIVEKIQVSFKELEQKIFAYVCELGREITLAVTESSYRATAELIGQTSGQGISAQGVWDMMQRLGERIDEEERYAVKQMEAGTHRRKKRTGALW